MAGFTDLTNTIAGWALLGSLAASLSSALVFVIGPAVGLRTPSSTKTSGLAGEYARSKMSTTRGDTRSRQRSEHTERVFKIGDLRQIPDGHALMLYQRLPAASCNCRPAGKQPSQPTPRGHGHRPGCPDRRRAAAMTGPQPLDRRVTSLEKTSHASSTSSGPSPALLTT